VLAGRGDAVQLIERGVTATGATRAVSDPQVAAARMPGEVEGVTQAPGLYTLIVTVKGVGEQGSAARGAFDAGIATGAFADVEASIRPDADAARPPA